MSAPDPVAFVRANTAVAAPPLVPEIRLHLASEITPIWEASEEALRQRGVAPPFWAFCWAGGQALARHVLDRPDTARGRNVLDFAAGGGVAAIAAALAGARRAIANDVDAFALAAAGLNAALNGAAVETLDQDLLDAEERVADLILAGDICYEQPLAGRVESWLRRQARAGATVLLGDPGRAYAPRHGLVEVARFDVPTPTEIEDRPVRTTSVWRVLP